MKAPQPALIAAQANLRAWRESRELTQEDVANILGVKHTTVGRWENLKVPLNMQQLQRLAEIYNASVPQLLAPPEDADLVARLGEAQEIILGLSQNELANWMGLGRSLLTRK